MAQRNVTLKLAACHPNTPSRYLQKFAKDKNESIRGAVASNPKTPPHLLSQLSNDEEITVRINVARNESTPKEVLLRLSRGHENFFEGMDQYDDEDYASVRAAVACNASAGNDALALLSADKDESVRSAVARNPLVDVDEVFGLDDKLNHHLLASYSKDAKTLDHLSTSGIIGVAVNVARNPCAPPDLLERLATSETPDVRFEVALNSNTDVSVLENLSRDSNVWVRSNVAKNRSTPSNILNRLVSFSEDEQVVCSAIENPATGVEAVASCLRSIMDTLDSTSPYDSHVNIPRLLESLSHRDDLPTAVLSQMSKSRFVDIRISVTTNARLPSSDLARLSREPVQFVVNFIADNPKVQGTTDALSGILSPSGYSKSET